MPKDDPLNAPSDRPKRRSRAKRAAREHGLRLFVGAYPPPDVADAFAALLPLMNLPDSRPTPAEQIHLTVQFIGPTDKRKLNETLEAVRRATRGIEPFELVPQSLIRLPPTGPARLIAVETDAPAGLLELHNRLARRFARKPRKRPSDRFLPHLTICRFTPPTSELDETFTATMPAMPAFPIDRIDLMQSTLSPNGAVHRRVQSVELARTA